MRRFLFSLVTLVISLAIGCAIAEVGLRRASDGTKGYRVSGRRFVRVQEFVRDKTKNSLGFHDVEPATTKRADQRVLLLGDSYVDASTVPVDQTVGRRFEYYLNDLSESDSYEVVAIGRSGWGQQAELRQMQVLISRLEPDIVLTLFLSFNDVTDDDPELRKRIVENDRQIFRKRPGWVGLPFDETPTLWWEDSELNRFLSFKLALFRFSGTKLSGSENLGIPYDYFVYRADYDEVWERAWSRKASLIKATRDLAHSKGAKYLMASASTPHGVLGRKDGLQWLMQSYPRMRDYEWDLDHPDRKLVEICWGLGVPVTTLEPKFREATAKGATLHFRYDGHWNRAGNDLAGKLLAEFVLDETP